MDPLLRTIQHRKENYPVVRILAGRTRPRPGPRRKEPLILVRLCLRGRILVLPVRQATYIVPW